LPTILVKAGVKAREATVNFFTAERNNPHTRRAYGRAVARFCQWADANKLELPQLKPFVIATYIKELEQLLAPPSVKQHLAALREFLDSLCRQHVLDFNPAAPVKGPRHVVKVGKTPVLTPAEARRMINSIDTSTIGGLRNRALIGVMLYSFARIGAVLRMNVTDFYTVNGRRWSFRLREKGGKHHVVPAHHMAEEFMMAYVTAGGLAHQKGMPLFRTLDRHRHLTDRRMDPNDALRMIKRCAKKVGLSAALCNHTWRATGITTYLLGGGTIERAAAIAAHESTRTTQLYNRTNDQINLDEIERIVI
jgi:site-specific recombinase XerD